MPFSVPCLVSWTDCLSSPQLLGNPFSHSLTNVHQNFACCEWDVPNIILSVPSLDTATTTTITTATTATTNQRCTRAITITHQQANRLQYRSCVSCHESESFVGAGKQTRARARVTNNNDNKLRRHNRRLTLLPTSLPPSSYHRHDPCRSARCAIRAAIYI